jgi:glycosyltransferase involved in cell wall biosynthesis
MESAVHFRRAPEGGMSTERPISVLMLHNSYQIAGGEDESFAAEAALLEANGHEVVRYHLHNDALQHMNPAEAALRTIWNPRSRREVLALIDERRPALVHAQNVFPLISPAAYDAARVRGIPIVQSLRNYRLFCLNAYFFREGQPCERCLEHAWPWPGVIKRCYRDSALASGAVAAMVSTHRALGTWRRIDRFIALSEFARRKFVANGLAEDRVALKPNFLPTDPGEGPGDGGYALFVGRLSPEKGLGTLLAAWRDHHRLPPLKVIGDGPLAAMVAAHRSERIEYLGRRPAAQVHHAMRRAALLVFPSEWYETFGRVAIEAYAAGTPVLASRIGAVAEIVRDGVTGRLFEPRRPEDLAEKALAMMSEPALVVRMRRAARAEFLAKYTAEANYRQLIEIYDAARAGAGEGGAHVRHRRHS